jgi:hypothetical protein
LSLQDKLAQSQILARNKLHDYMISQVGTETKVVRLKATRNLEGDFTDLEIISHDLITLRMSGLEEVPITRLRSSLLESTSTTENIFFYDILPIIAYSKYEDNLEKDDILIRCLKRGEEKFYHVLQVTEIIGNLSGNYLTFQKFQTSPYTEPLTEEVQEIIDNYKELE